MTEPTHDVAGAGHAAGMPRWVKVSAIVAAAVVLLLLVFLLTGGGGGHGPQRH